MKSINEERWWRVAMNHDDKEGQWRVVRKSSEASCWIDLWVKKRAPLARPALMSSWRRCSKHQSSEKIWIHDETMTSSRAPGGLAQVWHNFVRTRFFFFKSCKVLPWKINYGVRMRNAATFLQICQSSQSTKKKEIPSEVSRPFWDGKVLLCVSVQ